MQINKYATLIPHVEAELQRRVFEWAKPENKRGERFHRNLRRYYAMEAALHKMRGNEVRREDVKPLDIIQEALEWAGEIQKTLASIPAKEAKKRLALIKAIKMFVQELRDSQTQH